jgi:hypothetical protein
MDTMLKNQLCESAENLVGLVRAKYGNSTAPFKDSCKDLLKHYYEHQQSRSQGTRNGDTIPTTNMGNLPTVADPEGKFTESVERMPKIRRDQEAEIFHDVSLDTDDPPMDVEELKGELEEIDITIGPKSPRESLTRRQFNNAEFEELVRDAITRSLATNISNPSKYHNGETLPKTDWIRIPTSRPDECFALEEGKDSLGSMSGGRNTVDPPARTTDRDGNIRLSNRRWRAIRTPSPIRSSQMLSTKTNTSGKGPPMDDSDSDDSQASSAKERPDTLQEIDPFKIAYSAPWKQDSFSYKLLCWSLDLPEQFLVDLQEGMYIANTESFLEFFKDPPSLFLVRIPFPVDQIHEYHEQWYIASLVAQFFAYHLHPGERIKDYASMYDDDQSSSITQQLDVLHGVGRYLHQCAATARPAFQACFEAAVAQLRRAAPMRNSFSQFSASIGRPIPTTPPAPAPAPVFEHIRSPIVEPMVRKGMRFINMPPYTRKGMTYETQHQQNPYQSAPSFQYPYYYSGFPQSSQEFHKQLQRRLNFQFAPIGDTVEPTINQIEWMSQAPITRIHRREWLLLVELIFTKNVGGQDFYRHRGVIVRENRSIECVGPAKTCVPVGGGAGDRVYPRDAGTGQMQ